MLDAPMFLSRWRWNLNRSLLVLRFRGGRRNPPPIQRMEADDLMAAVFPQAAACQENVVGPIEIPDHVHRAPDHRRHAARSARRRRPARAARRDRAGDGRGAHGRHDRTVGARARDPHRPAVRVPRRRRAAEPAHQRGHAAARAQRRPRVDRPARRRGDRAGARRDHAPTRDRPTTSTTCCARSWSRSPGPTGSRCGTSSRERGRAGRGPTRRRRRCGARPRCATTPRASFADDDDGDRRDGARAPRARGHHHGRRARRPRAGSRPAGSRYALAVLEQQGQRAAGHLHRRRDGIEWVARRLLARMHSYSRRTRRESAEPATAQDFMRFLLRWQHFAPGHAARRRRRTRDASSGSCRAGRRPPSAWEPELLRAPAARLRRRRRSTGSATTARSAWLRLNPRRRATSTRPAGAPQQGDADRGAVPRRPAVAARGGARRHRSGRADVGRHAPRSSSVLRERGACFATELGAATNRLPEDIERGLWERRDPRVCSSPTASAPSGPASTSEPARRARPARSRG